MKTATRTAALLAAIALGAAAAHAHDDAFLDKQKAPNGGQLRVAGAYHYELVVVKTSKEAKENPIVVYVTDHADNKVTTAGATGTATLLAGKQKVVSTLKPDGGNRMKGSASYASAPDMKVVVLIALPGQPAEQARFTPLTPAEGGEKK